MGKLLASILKIDFLEMKERDFFLKWRIWQNFKIKSLSELSKIDPVWLEKKEREYSFF